MIVALLGVDLCSPGVRPGPAGVHRGLMLAGGTRWLVGVSGTAGAGLFDRFSRPRRAAGVGVSFGFVGGW